MDEVKSRVVDLSLNDVLPNRFQPRIKFSEDSIIELSESIKEHGVIQPIVVRPIGDKYEIIAGERRYKASVLAGKDKIPAIISDLNDKDSAEIALIENVQRKDLTAIEEAISYKKILDMGYLTQEQLAIKLGRSQSTVANKIRLLNLCDEVQEALMEDKISERHARSMLKLQTADQQRIMLDKIIKERLTVRKTDEEIDKMNTYITNPIEPEDVPTSNPGFVDVDKIANNAQDLKFEDNSGNVNINALLQGNSMTAIKPVETSSSSGVTPNMFGNQSMPSVAPVDLMASNAQVAPALEQVPLTPVVDPLSAIPAVQTESVMPEVATTMPEVAPVMPEIAPVPAMPVVEPVMVDVPQIPSIEPVSSEANSEIFSGIPTITPIANMAPSPATPIVEEALPSQFSVPVEETVKEVAPVTPEVPVIDQATIELNEAENKLSTQPVEATPIIITDYSKQYDPIIPNIAPAPVEKVDFKQIINLIRDVNATIEKCGYTIETEEYDLEGVYQVIFKINKE